MISFPKFKDKEEKKNFFTFFTAYSFTMMGSKLAYVAFLTAILNMTKEKPFFAYYIVAIFLPKAIIPLFASKIFKKYSLQKIVFFTQTIAGLMTLIQLYFYNISMIWMFLLFALLKYAFDSFINPTTDCFLSTLFHAERNELNRAFSLFHTIDYICMTVATAAGGLLLLLCNVSTIITIDAITFFVSAMLFYRLKSFSLYQNYEANEPVKKFVLLRNILKMLKDNFLLRRMSISHILRSTADGILNFLLPVLLFHKFKFSGSQYSLVIAGFGASMIIAGILSTKNIFSNISQNTMNRFITVSTFLNGITLYLSYSSNNIFAFIILLYASGMFSMFSITYMKTVIQSGVEIKLKSDIAIAYVSSRWFFFTLGALVSGLFFKYMNELMLTTIVCVFLIAASMVVALFFHHTDI